MAIILRVGNTNVNKNGVSKTSGTTHQPLLEEVRVKVSDAFHDGVTVEAADDGRHAGHYKVEGLLVHVLRQQLGLKNIKRVNVIKF